MDRELKVQMDANLENQGLARAVAAAYVSQADPTVEELTEVKTAVSEAFSNAAIHGYENRGGIVKMEFSFISKDTIMIKVMDSGIGIDSQSHGTSVYYRYGPEQIRYGIHRYGKLHGQDKGRFQTRRGNGSDHGEEAGYILWNIRTDRRQI